MSTSTRSPSNFFVGEMPRTIFLALAIALISVSCGSTKIMTVNKTLVYRDAIYNLSNTNIFTRSEDAFLSEGETINLDGIDKNGIRSLLDEHGDMRVRQVFRFDDTELVYRSMNVSSWSEYKRMNRRFDNAAKDLQKFLAHKKDTQLKLK